ncbi:MAG: AAA family ATPase [Oscillospiraceae bacterium]|nr:AAA family ATPase [Oscillospiraceae bacterium]
MEKLEIIKASDVTVREIEWLWYPFIPYGKVTILQGDPGDGKSLMVLKLAAMLTKGESMPFTDGEGQEPINVIYQSSEDDADDTIVPRFLRSGGDPEKLLFINEKEKFLSFSDERILAALEQTKARLLILDPLSAYIGEGTQLNSANAVRAQFRPLIEIAKRLRCAILVIHHQNKQIGQKAINRSTGSGDVIAASRSGLIIARTDRDHPDERILAQVKCNVGPTGNAILFSVSNGEVEWLSEESRTADEVLGNVFTGPSGRSDTQLRAAKEALQQLLADGPKPQREIMERIKGAGIGESTAKKAKALLAIRSEKQGSMWFWSLPDA